MRVGSEICQIKVKLVFSRCYSSGFNTIAGLELNVWLEFTVCVYDSKFFMFLNDCKTGVRIGYVVGVYINF